MDWRPPLSLCGFRISPVGDVHMTGTPRSSLREDRIRRTSARISDTQRVHCGRARASPRSPPCARVGCGRHHGHLQRRQCGDAAATAVHGTRSPRADLGKQRRARLVDVRGVASQFPRLAIAVTQRSNRWPRPTTPGSRGRRTARPKSYSACGAGDDLESRGHLHRRSPRKPTREAPLRDQQRVRLTVETIDEPERDREAAIARLKAGHREHAFFLGGARFPRLLRPELACRNQWSKRETSFV